MTLEHFLILSGIIFSIGLLGVIISRGILKILLSLEILLMASNIAFVALSKFNGDFNGQLIVFFIILVAAAEVAIGLAIVVLIYKHFSHIDADELKELRC